MTDTVLQRKNMVESQVRPSDVTDRRITSAMLDVPRDHFVPADKCALAYMDEALLVAPDRSLMAPRDFARLVQLAAIEPNDTVLIVGALGGYSSAILARLAKHVVALDCDSALTSAAGAALQAAGVSNVTIVTGSLTAGWAAAAPFDVILIEGGVELIPEPLFAQLAASGRLVAVEWDKGVGRAVVRQKTASTVSRREAFEAAAPLLPGFGRAKAFAF